MELLDIYDENRMKTGETIIRGKEPVPEGCYLLVVHICIFDSEKRMLIQQRQPFKSSWSGMWDVSVGGCAVSGDTSLSAALREVSEELGIDLFPEKLRRAATVYDFDVIDDYYIYSYDEAPDISKLTLQETEVCQVKWADEAEVMSLIESGEFIPYHASLIDLLFHFRVHSGARTSADNTTPEPKGR